MEKFGLQVISTFVSHNKEFLYGPRGFTNIFDMNKTIVDNWNSIVDMDDDVYVLGDIMLNDNETGIKLLKSLKGRIHIICGNHCTDARRELYAQCYNVVEVVDATRITYNGYHFFLSHYPTICSNYDDGKPLKKRCINLCGHSHYRNRYKDMDKGLIYHCEVDCCHNTPIEINNIINDLNWFYNLTDSDRIKIMEKEVYENRFF